jgi:hypothetical protein
MSEHIRPVRTVTEVAVALTATENPLGVSANSRGYSNDFVIPLCSITHRFARGL